MPPTSIDYLAVIAAAVAAFAVGALWYGPLFGRSWIAAHGYSEQELAEMRTDPGKSYFVSFIALLVTASVLSMVLGWTGIETVSEGIRVAFVCWLGFMLTVGVTTWAFSNRKAATLLIDAAHQLAYMLIMGAILTAWPW